MGCRCNERREAIGRGIIALAKGDLSTARSAAAFVGRSAVEDLRLVEARQRAAQQLFKARLVRR